MVQMRSIQTNNMFTKVTPIMALKKKVVSEESCQPAAQPKKVVASPKKLSEEAYEKMRYLKEDAVESPVSK